MRKIIVILLLLGAHLNLTAIVPLLPGDPPPPWWVGGRLLWPFAIETNTLIPAGDLLNTITPILGISAAICFLLATAALFRWVVPEKWFRSLILAGVVFSIMLQAVWFTIWAVLPLLVDIILVWAVFGRQITVSVLRKEK